MAVSRINTGFFKGGIKFIWHYKTEKKDESTNKKDETVKTEKKKKTY